MSITDTRSNETVVGNAPQFWWWCVVNGDGTLDVAVVVNDA